MNLIGIILMRFLNMGMSCKQMHLHFQVIEEVQFEVNKYVKQFWKWGI